MIALVIFAVAGFCVDLMIYLWDEPEDGPWGQA